MELGGSSHPLEQIPAASITVILKQQDRSPIRERISSQEEQRYVGNPIVGELCVGMLDEQCGDALFEIVLPACRGIGISETAVLE